VDRFLQVAVEPIGYVPHDDYVTLAVMRQKAVADLFPDSPAAQAFARLAEQVMQWPLPDLPKSSVQLLWRRMIHLG
jgi:flagellar biosynthesis protein FlhG